MIADIKPTSITLFHACVDMTVESIRLATSVARFASSSLAELRREVDALLAREFGDDPKAKNDERSKCINDLRMAAGMLRKVSSVGEPVNAENFRIAAAYELAADLLETPV